LKDKAHYLFPVVGFAFIFKGANLGEIFHFPTKFKVSDLVPKGMQMKKQRRSSFIEFKLVLSAVL